MTEALTFTKAQAAVKMYGESMIPDGLIAAMNALITEKMIDESVTFAETELEAKMLSVSGADIKDKLAYCKSTKYSYVLAKYSSSQGWDSKFSNGNFTFKRYYAASSSGWRD